MPSRFWIIEIGALAVVLRGVRDDKYFEKKKNGDKYDNGVGQLVELHSFAIVHVLICYSFPVYSIYELLMFHYLRWALFLLVQYGLRTKANAPMCISFYPPFQHFNKFFLINTKHFVRNKCLISRLNDS